MLQLNLGISYTMGDGIISLKSAELKKVNFEIKPEANANKM